ncbi:peptidoglycan-binding LysM domain protein [Roridomyces roridus]|uniref:Peptidoglycan-binding LysM domain protein n=1 Tax=Roridomyces roridus TaxID=1738132 RepID=A0AAD7CEG8_9AGAR|nr:peptidoglycan-binding LysM domain protein [Roridomyces roridus]
MSNGRKPVTPESIYYNPFAEDPRQRTTAIDRPFLSDRNLRPAVRRRASSSDDAAESSASSSSGISVFTSAPRHMRIRTEPGSTDYLSAGFRTGAGVTRPQLTRIVNIAPLVDAPPVPGADMIVAEPEENEKVVLVHEVTPQDSLAGVSLKYGISLAELRRANHLWASDPIHLRKVLYIPLDKTKERVPSAILVSTEDDDRQSSHSDTPAPPSTIRRIPVSQLSFFPPPAKPQELPPPPSPPPQPIPRTKHPHSRHARYATTPTPGVSGSPSFTSILSALPIQPSTRDTIIARLSYESTSSGHSDQPDEGHELDDVRRGASLDSSATALSPEFATPKPKPRPSHARTSSASMLYGGGGGAQYNRAGPPRTVQLEPSPAMQLPMGFGTIRRKPKARVNGDFDLLGLGAGEGEGETVDDM